MFEILENQSVISITGLDAKRFLQSLTTNDIINNAYSHNYLLNNQGRYLFDFFVHTNENDCFLIEVDKESTDRLIKCFNLYKLRSEVHLSDCSEKYKVIYSRDPLEFETIKSNQDPRYKKLGIRSIVNLEDIGDLRKSSSNVYIMDKYKYSIPDGNSDLIFEKSIPIEYGAEELNSISYSKGCYIGQEVISRTKYQGVIRKKIYHLSSDDNNLNAQKGDDITDFAGNKIGVICSAHNNQGISLLREELVLALGEKIAMINNIKVSINVPSWRK